MQKLLNLKVKFREGFRPFAPAVLREDVGDWFELDADLEEAGDKAAQFSTPSRSQQYSSRHSLASSTQRASESQGSTVSNA